MFKKPVNRWWTVLAGALGCAGGSGVVASWVFGVFVKEISRDFGWQRTVTTAGIFFFYLAFGLGCLSLGDVMSRWGVRSSSLIFVMIFVISIAGIGFLPDSPLLFCIVYSFMGFFGAAATALPYSIAIAGWFDRNRGLALALVVGGTGVSAMFISRYANWLLTNFGWRGGYIGIAVFCAAVALPGLTFFFSMPPGAPGPRVAARWRPILANPNLWLMTIPLFFISVAVYGITTNLAPLFTDRGMSMGSAATLLGVLGGTSGISRIVTGAVMDRIHVRFVSAVVFLLAGCGIALVAYGHIGGLATSAGVVAIGVGLGAEAGIMGFAVSYYFGADSLPRAGGVVFAACAWGGGVGNALGSISYDLTGSYGGALVAYISLAVLSAVVILQLGPYKSTVLPERLSPLPSTAIGTRL